MGMGDESEDQSAVAIVIVDRQAVVHAGIRFWLAGSDPEIKIVGNFSDPTQFRSVYPTSCVHSSTTVTVQISTCCVRSAVLDIASSSTPTT
jgi:hypothetical protein